MSSPCVPGWFAPAGDLGLVGISYEAAPIDVRDDLVVAHQRAWQRLAAPGTWWKGRRRVAIAAETRNAAICGHCRDSKAALSPYTTRGTHDTAGNLPESIIEIIHKIATDPGRLTRAWFDHALSGGLSDGEFVETVSVVVTTIAVDTFTRAIGIPQHPLPNPANGDNAWVPMLAPEDMTETEACLKTVYVSADPTFIRRALSLVPDEACGLFDLVDAQYLPGSIMTDLTTQYRAITRTQMELIAGRVSAINGCFY